MSLVRFAARAARRAPSRRARPVRTPTRAPSRRPASRRGRSLGGGLAALAALVTASGTLGAPAGASSTPARSGARPVSAAVAWPSPQWVAPTVTGTSVGHVAQSSPTAAVVGGRTIVAVGAENGYVYLVDATTGAELPGWPRRMAAPPGGSVAIESSPTIAWLDGPGRPPSIIVGSGSTWVPDTVGEVEAFRLNGSVRWVFRVGAAPGTAVGVISSPAVGDLTGSGQQDVVFGSWDHNLYALDPSGKVLPGFPYNAADTIWSSPSLYRLAGHAGADIFLASDASGRAVSRAPGASRCYGGFLADYRYVHRSVVREWYHCENQVIWSSPAVGTIGSSHRPVVVVGTGFYYQPFPSDTDKVLAYYADNGAPVPGWPVSTAGPALGSPAIGVINGSGTPSVVETTWVCSSPERTGCFAGYQSQVDAWSGNGTLLWSRKLVGPTDLASPVLVPLQGESTDDVLVGSPAGLYPLSGSTGSYLFGTNGTFRSATVNAGCAVYNSVAVVDVPGVGPRSGWHVFEGCGGPSQLHRAGELASYRLPIQPASAAAWPMFRGGPEHDGVAFSSLPSVQPPVPGAAVPTTSAPGGPAATVP